jgi:signal transduction histidine kinase
MRRLFARIYLHFLGVLLVVAVVSSLVFAWTARGAFVQESSGRISRHISSLVAEVFRDPPALARRVQQIHDELELDLVVRDLHGRLLVSSGAELPSFTPEQLAQVRTGLRMVQPNPEWSVAIPVRDPRSGVVMGTLESSAHRRARWRALSRPTLILTMLLVLFAVPAAALAHRISRPVERLTEAARRLGAGDLTARVPVSQRSWWRRRRDSSSDELATLTRAFNDMAERIERLIAGQKELMANISHELRSPLTRIRVALELLPHNGATQARLEDVEADLDELERLIEDVLTATRLEVTGLPPHPERVEVQRLLEDLAERARLDPRLGPERVRMNAGSPIELEADPALLRRALWNLVDNAAKYGAPPVALSAERHNGTVALSVSDDGPGIPPEERERVLAPFYQIDRARTPGKPARGFGLGLTLAGRVAQVHHGAITIGPATTIDGTERGCRVTLTLPVGRGE